MKRKILHSLKTKFLPAFLCLSFLLSLEANATLQRGRISTLRSPRTNYTNTSYEQNAIYLPVLFLKGSKNIPADPQKGFELLQYISQLDSAKTWIAYCYELGLGTEKDTAKAEETLNAIKDFYHIRVNISKFLDDKADIAFALKLADFNYAKTNNFRESYRSIVRNASFKAEYNDRYNAIIQELEKNAKENVGDLIDIYTNTKDYAKLIDIIDLIEENHLKSYNYNIENTFFYCFDNREMALLEKLIKSENFNKSLNNTKAELMLYLAYCKSYAYGTELDKAGADILIDKYVELSKTSKNTYYIERLARSGLKNVDSYIYELANTLSNKGDSEILSYCLREGVGCKKDREASFKIDYKLAMEKGFSFQNLRNKLIINFLKIYKEGAATPEMEAIAFETLDTCLDDKYISSSDIIIYYNLTLMGYGDENSKGKALKKLEEFSLNATHNLKLAITETLAYFYENGIGTKKDEAKAKELRLEIDNIVQATAPKERWSYLYFIGTYTSDKNELHKIYSPEMLKFYQEKAAPFKYDSLIGYMPDADIKLMMEFREISKLFKEENGKPLKDKAKLAAAKKSAREFFQKVLDAKSQAMYKIAEFSFNFYKNTDLDTLQLRVTGLPYFIKASEYDPKIYKHLAKAYEAARGTRGDYKIAGDYYFKIATMGEEISDLPKKDAFKKALSMYLKVCDYASAKKALDGWEKSTEPSAELDIEKIKFYLAESEYKDVDYARVLVAKIKESAKDVEILKTLYFIRSDGYLELKELRFFIAKMLYETNIELDGWTMEFAYKQLISAYMRGIYCEKDIEKGLSFLKEYFIKGKAVYIYDAFVVDQLIILLRDIEDRDPTLLKTTIESLLEVDANSASLNLLKAIAIDEGFGYEKDIALRDSCLEKVKKNPSLLYSFTKRYNVLSPSEDLVATFAKLSPKTEGISLGLFNAYCRAGNLEEAQKYGKIYDAKGTVTTYDSPEVACLILKTKGDEDLAKAFSKSKLRGSQALYASMLYEGKGVAQDKDKAVEIFENLSKLWKSGEIAGDNSRLWLWKHYTETNQSEKAQALIDPKSQGSSLYNAKYLMTAARVFKDCLDIDSINFTSNMPANEEYAKYFLTLLEDKYLLANAEELVDLYGTNPNFKNLEKKREIMEKIKLMLNSPNPKAKEEVNYPKRDRGIRGQVININ